MNEEIPQNVNPATKSNKYRKCVVFIIIILLLILGSALFIQKYHMDSIDASFEADSGAEMIVKNLLSKQNLSSVSLSDYDANVVPDSIKFNSNYSHFAYAAKNGNDVSIYLDGTLIPISGSFPYEISDFAFSPDGKHFAFMVKRMVGKNTGILEPNNLKYTLYFDGKPSRTYDYITALTFSPNGERYAYRASDGRGDRLVVDGVEQATYTQIDDDVIAFSPDGKRLAYRIEDGHQRAYFVIDGVRQGIQTDPSSLDGFVFSSDSQHYAYVYLKNADSLEYGIILDGVTMQKTENSAPQSLRISPDDKTVAYIIQPPEGQYVIVGNNKYGPFERMSILEKDDKVIFDSDGNHFAFRATKKIVDPVYGVPIPNAAIVVSDGKILGPYDGVGNLAFSKDNKLTFSTDFCTSNDESYAINSTTTSTGKLVCVMQSRRTANNSFITNEIKWGDKIIASVYNFLIVNIYPFSSGNGLVYEVFDTHGNLGGNRYYLVYGKKVSGPYDHIYGPIKEEGDSFLFWTRSGNMLTLISTEDQKIWKEGIDFNSEK
jgi:dipeptidyl aminopeptidase/acylaminoacyl peptidase